MRKIIIFIIFLISIFIVNLIFYFISDDYRFFIKKIKNPDRVVYLEEKNYDDNIENKDIIKKDKILDKKILNNAEIIATSKDNKKIFKLKSEDWVVNLKDEIILWKTYRYILDIFSIYKLKKLEVNLNLFDITDEYPDNYFEYYSKNLTLYIFPTKNYKQIYDIFDVLSKESPFSINQVNNFWDNSFFINLDKDIQDRFVRVIISYKWVVFWLKIKKTEYSLVKEKLKSLKNNY